VSLAFKMKLEGGDQAIRALRVLEPTVARKVTKEVSKAGKLVAALIESRAPKEPPMSGWRTTPTASPHGYSRGGAGWNADVVFSAISATSRASNMSVIIRTDSGNYAAIIYESAGIKGGRWSRGKGKSGDGAQFIANLQRPPYGPLVQSGKYQGRLARKAIADKYPEFIRQLEFACDQAVDEINKRLP
jgi:hypothetical protein